MNRRIVVRGAACALVLGLASACVYPGNGPPPWAPAHGARRKHGGATLVYDAGLGVYVVEGMPGYYYLDDRFYRYAGSAWQVSVNLNGPWYAAAPRSLPPGLAKQGGGRVPPGQAKRR